MRAFTHCSTRQYYSVRTERPRRRFSTRSTWTMKPSCTITVTLPKRRPRRASRIACIGAASASIAEGVSVDGVSVIADTLCRGMCNRVPDGVPERQFEVQKRAAIATFQHRTIRGFGQSSNVIFSMLQPVRIDGDHIGFSFGLLIQFEHPLRYCNPFAS